MIETDLMIIDIPGVGAETEKRLRAAGYTSLEEVAATPVREIIDRAKLGEDMALRVVEGARKLLSPSVLATALDLYNRRKERMDLSTGCRALDQLLGGGVETQAITEFVGEYATGKSQLCMKLGVMVQLPKEKGGLDGKALFIDTEGTFSPERIYDIASSLGLDPEKTLANIWYARAENSDHQIFLVEHAGELIQRERVKLLIVDSVISHFRGEYIGRETLSERQQKLNQHVHRLLRIAEVHNIAVIVTNQTQASPGVFFGDPNKPAGGNVLAHATTHRIYIRRAREHTRLARVMDSPKLPEGEAYFKINEKGVDDIVEKDRVRGKSEEAD